MDWKLKTYGGVLYKGYIWFSNNTFNGLFRINVESRNVEFVDFFPKTPILSRLTHKKCFLYNEKIYFLPAFSNHIHIYDLTYSKFETIEFSDPAHPVLKDRVGDAVVLNHKIYIFSWIENEPLIIFDLNDHTLKRNESFDVQKGKNGISKDFQVVRCFNYGADRICFAVCGTDYYAEWNVIRNELRLMHSGMKNVFSVTPIEEDIWIVKSGDDSIYRFDREKSTRKYKGIGGEKFEFGERYYSGLVHFNNMIIGVPAFSEKIVCWKEGIAVEINGDKWKCCDKRLSAFLGTVNLDDELWLLPFSADGIYSYNRITDCVTRIDFTIEDEDVKRIILKEVFDEGLEKGSYIEDINYTLYDYICILNEL